MWTKKLKQKTFFSESLGQNHHGCALPMAKYGTSLSDTHQCETVTPGAINLQSQVQFLQSCGQTQGGGICQGKCHLQSGWPSGLCGPQPVVFIRGFKKIPDSLLKLKVSFFGTQVMRSIPLGAVMALKFLVFTSSFVAWIFGDLYCTEPAGLPMPRFKCICVYHSHSTKDVCHLDYNEDATVTKESWSSTRPAKQRVRLE